MRTILGALILFISLPAFGDDLHMPLSIQEVKKQHEARLFDMPGVVSVGIGLDPNGNPAIVVGLDRPRPETEAKLPAKLADFPVVIQIIGSIKAQ